MRFFFLLAFLSLAISDTQREFGDLDDLDNIDEDEFEEYFSQERDSDPREREKKRDALKQNEEMVKRENEEFLKGNKTWFARIDEYSNLPEEEFKQERNGMESPRKRRGRNRSPQYSLGLLEPHPDLVNEESEKYFDKFRYSRAAVPSQWNSVEKGWVSHIKNQGRCGSCVAFATATGIETCYKKLTGVFGDYSEQEMVDCGYNRQLARGCRGAQLYGYTKWIVENKRDLASEHSYPYKGKRHRCPQNVKSYNLGARVSKSYWTQVGTEELLKKLVAKHGAVITGVNGYGPFQSYAGGIFQGCRSRRSNHAVSVVGYGSENGVDYWLIKNSWGTSYGEKGYIRLRRGTGECGIGKYLVTVSCEKVRGQTDAPPPTTAVPCFDKHKWCSEKRTLRNCKRRGADCPKSCGLCPGMDPHVSNTCADEYGHGCPELATRKCYKQRYKDACCFSCGLGPGMTPAESNYCYDYYGTQCYNEEDKRMCGQFKNRCKKACGICRKKP